MSDLSKYSDEQLEKITTGDFSGFSDDELLELSGASAGRATASELIAKKIGMPILKGLDYLGGQARTQIAKPFLDEPQKAKAQKAASGASALSSSELLEKMGVGAGGQLSDIASGLFSETGKGLPLKKGGMFDITPRGVAGFGLDVATDPLTYLGGPIAKILQKTATGGKAASRGLKKVGDTLYKMPFREADRAATKAGFPKLSETLKNIGSPTMGTYTAEDVIQSRISKLINQQKDIINEAVEKNVPIDIQKGLSQAKEEVAKLAKSNYAPDQDAAKSFGSVIAQQEALKETAGKPKTILRKKLEYGAVDLPPIPETEITSLVGNIEELKKVKDPKTLFELFKGRPTNVPVTVTELIKGRPAEIKKIKPTPLDEKTLPAVPPRGPTTMADAMRIKKGYGELAKSVYDARGNISPTITSQQAKLYSKIAKGFQGQTEEAAKKIGRLDELKAINKELGTYANTSDYISGDVTKMLRKEPFTEVTAIAAALSPVAAGAKELARASKTMRFKTGAGRRLSALGGKADAIEKILGGGAEKGAKAVSGPGGVGLRRILQLLEEE